MSDSERTRREFLRSAAIGSAAVGALGTGWARPAGAQPPAAEPAAATGWTSLHPDHGAIHLGVASYSLRAFPRDYVIDACQQLGTP